MFVVTKRITFRRELTRVRKLNSCVRARVSPQTSRAERCGAMFDQTRVLEEGRNTPPEGLVEEMRDTRIQLLSVVGITFSTSHIFKTRLVKSLITSLFTTYFYILDHKFIYYRKYVTTEGHRSCTCPSDFSAHRSWSDLSGSRSIARNNLLDLNAESS